MAAVHLIKALGGGWENDARQASLSPAKSIR